MEINGVKEMLEFILTIFAFVGGMYAAVKFAIQTAIAPLKQTLEALTEAVRELHKKLSEQDKTLHEANEEIIGLKHNVKEIYRRLDKVEGKTDE